MDRINRRGFLALAGGATAMAALSPSIARAAAIPADRRTGTIADIEHIVVLMQENRSFDHYFGALRGVRGFGDRTPVTLPDGTSVWNQSGVLPFRPDVDDLGMQFLQDLPHGWNDGHDAFHGGRYDRWVPAKSPTTMAYLTRDDIPFHYALADSFTICDAYHCSLMGPTDPNRYYMWTGYTGNDGRGGGPVVTNDELGYGWTTYPERLEAAGVSWKIYQDVGDGLDAAGYWGWTSDPYIGNYGDNSLLYFDNYRNAAPGTPLYEKARTGTNLKAGDDMFAPLRDDVLAGNLPQVSWIVAPEAYTEHPNWPANYGAWYIAQVLDALTADPKVWARTALLITYDENDGFFDHAVPAYPTAGNSTADLRDEFLPASNGHVAGPYGLGQRVPMLVVSPWSTGGYVCSEVFDHTSIVRFIEKRFGVHEPNISPWRRAVCGDLTAAFDFAKTRPAPPRLPDTRAYAPADRNRHPDYVPTPPADPKLPTPEHGVRPARPLRYDLAADARYAAGEVRVTFASRAGAGAVFYVTEAGGTPRTYTAAARTHLTGTWPDTTDLSVHGPNGFFRRFRTPGVEVSIRQSRLTLSNPSSKATRVVLTDAYSGERWPIRLNPGQSQTRHLPHHHDWYDVTVTSDITPTYLRRLVGHIEGTEPGVSQP
ncbi:phosphocholine-specific phospholipase C [Paractinoplanes durhamensis]|uniref:phospholipase C n=1 Tax=Paractinoplanes durhamensis TaxID=113563 RepID=A0ABQ3Z5J6_9ACTN|nr:phospholipase C, phosphocholine-specific [Actinoplanes durhamensis]GIE05061.1 phospholipase C, phosphocholine-specific [Actinoplanes durhamensis]